MAEVGAESALVVEPDMDFVDKGYTEMHKVVVGEETDSVDEQVNNEFTVVACSSPYPELGIIDAGQRSEQLSHSVVVWDEAWLQGLNLLDGLLQQVAGDTKCTDEEVVKWDDELQHHNNSHDGPLNLLARCVDYKIGEEAKPISIQASMMSDLMLMALSFL